MHPATAQVDLILPLPQTSSPYLPCRFMTHACLSRQVPSGHHHTLPPSLFSWSAACLTTAMTSTVGHVFQPDFFQYLDTTSPSLSHGFSVLPDSTHHATLVSSSKCHLSAVGHVLSSSAVLRPLSSSSTLFDPCATTRDDESHCLGWFADVEDRRHYWPGAPRPSLPLLDLP